MYESRKGFYCSICNASNHKYYDEKTMNMTMNFDFCKEMVNHTLSFFIFKFRDFMKISRIFAKYLTKCNIQGKYFPTKYINHGIKFFRKKKINYQINICLEQIKTPEALRFCKSFCKAFNPTVFNKFLEGGLNRLYSYKIALKKMSKKA